MSSPGWRLDEVQGIRFARCEALEGVPGIAHAFSTRRAHGQSDFDLGSAECTDDVVGWRRVAFLRAAGFGEVEPRILRQVHGDRLVDVAEGAERRPEADGSFQRLPEGSGSPIPAVRTADCVAVLLADRGARAVAAIHAGWRGTVKGIAAKGVAALRTQGVEPAELVVAMGPAILGCCYEVGEDVAAALVAACPRGRFTAGVGAAGQVTVDLHAANRAQLIAAGVHDGAIHAAPWCTRCRNDLFFSVRAEGDSAGRLMAAVGPRPAP